MGRPLCGQEVMKATGGRSSPIDGHGRQGRKLGVMELRELAFYRRLGREVGEDLAFQMTAALAGVAVARTAASWGGGSGARLPAAVVCRQERQGGEGQGHRRGKRGSRSPTWWPQGLSVPALGAIVR
jgi:hypothetical protein